MKRSPRDRRCSYLLHLDHEGAAADDLRDLAEYLSLVASADIDVVVVDSSEGDRFEEHRQVLRWVARHVAAKPQHRTASGTFDPVRAAIDVAACDKVIVAGHGVRYCADSLDEVCELLAQHEVVEPQDYLDPLPWWGGIEAGRILVHRGLDPLPDQGPTFAFRRSAIRGLRAIDGSVVASDHVRRLSSHGAEVFSAFELFVRRVPPSLDEWWRERPVHAGSDFFMPAKTVFFLSLLPIAILIGFFGGAAAAGMYAGTIACGAFALALRGRSGATHCFPWRACFFAPLWVLERSVSVYWALALRLREASAPQRPMPAVDRRTGERDVIAR